jgi:hypothetical protein
MLEETPHKVAKTRVWKVAPIVHDFDYMSQAHPVNAAGSEVRIEKLHLVRAHETGRW